METYAVSDVAEMLSVNAETVRRWIRDGKIKAERAVGRGGNSILLQDVIDFVNKPPREYIHSMEAWLKSAGIEYETIKDTVAATAIGVATLAATPVLGAAGIAYYMTKKKSGKKFAAYSIKLIDPHEDIPESGNNLVSDDEKGQIDNDAVGLKKDIVSSGESPKTNDVLSDASASTTLNVLDEITHAKQLLDAGILTEDEFIRIKEKLIAKL